MNSNRRRPLYLALAVLPMAGMSFSLARADDPHAVAASTHDDAPLTKAAAEMADAASRFWAALTPEQQQTTGYKFDDDERFDWHFIPKPRKGLTIKEMTQAQRDLAHALLSTGLSHKGYLEASTIMSLEPVLFDLEQGKGQNKRDSELYYFTIFGKPGNEGAWGWRVEGHHFSLNVTIVDGTAPKDIITFNKRKAMIDNPAGIAFAQLHDAEKKQLKDLVADYAERLRGELADDDLKRIDAAGWDNVKFAWAGGLDRGQPHYYRVQGPTFLVEYDNTQNNANHVHSVWRDLTRDFGEDLLLKHYQADHAGK